MSAFKCEAALSQVLANAYSRACPKSESFEKFEISKIQAGQKRVIFPAIPVHWPFLMIFNRNWAHLPC